MAKRLIASLFFLLAPIAVLAQSPGVGLDSLPSANTLGGTELIFGYQSGSGGSGSTVCARGWCPVSITPTQLAYFALGGTILPTGKGGTGISATPTNGQLLIGNGSGYTLTTLTGGSNITITNSAGGITIAASGGGGSLPSCTTSQLIYYASSGTTGTCLTLGTNLSISGSTLNATAGGGGVSSFSGDGALLTNSASTGGVTATLGNTGLAYGVWGSISASSGAPAYHSMSSYPTAAFPTFNQNTTGTASNLSGTPALPNGTTATTQTTGDSTTKIATDAFVIANAGSGSCGSISNNTLCGNNSGSTGAGSGLTPSQAIGVLTSGTPNAQTGTSYTTVLGDGNGEVTMSNASANTLTIPTNASVAFAVGTVITTQQLSTGLTTVSPASGVTFQSAQFGSSATQGYPLGGDFGLIQLQKVATNTWNVIAYQPGQGAITLSGTCTHSANTGDGYGGTYTMSSAGNCTVIATPNLLPAQVLWTGFMTDATQPTIPGWGPTSESATAVTFTVPTAVASSDVLVYNLARH